MDITDEEFDFVFNQGLREGIKKGRIQGIAFFVASYLESRGMDTLIEDIWNADGMSLEACRNNEVDEFDMIILETYFGIGDNDE